jgi:hypothetical protein
MCNVYRQEFVDEIIEPLRNMCLQIQYTSAVIIPYVTGMSEEFICIRNRFSVWPF